MKHCSKEDDWCLPFAGCSFFTWSELRPKTFGACGLYTCILRLRYCIRCFWMPRTSWLMHWHFFAYGLHIRILGKFRCSCIPRTGVVYRRLLNWKNSRLRIVERCLRLSVILWIAHLFQTNQSIPPVKTVTTRETPQADPIPGPAVLGRDTDLQLADKLHKVLGAVGRRFEHQHGPS